MLVAEVACVLRGETRREVRATAYLVSVLANNLPDVDIVYTWLTGPKPLGGLLHHRGHSHTLLLALPAAWLLGWLFWRRSLARIAGLGPRQKQLIYGLALSGVVLHLLLDFGNNYGVHPFWPLSGRWFYGDTIFIVEPSWWSIAIPVLVFCVERRWLKLTLGSLLGALLLVCWFVPFVLPAARVALLALAGVSVAMARLGSARQRAVYAIAGWLIVAGVFAAGSRLAKAELRRALESAFPALQVQDLAVTPVPANPACWEGLAAGEQGGRYRVIRASVALFGLGAGDCSAGGDVAPTAPTTPVSRATHGGVRFRNEYEAPVAELRALARDDCRFRALLRFARLPYFTPPRNGRRYAGDLRYDRAPALEFADLALNVPPSTEGCPRLVPAWIPPRAELFTR